jgi:hypothetical protein
MIRPRLKEVITLPEHEEHYTIKFIQHFFTEQGEFQYIMITGVRKSY